MTVLARDHVAADHLVYPWPFPIGPECEVSCADDEQVVMCPAWLVGDRLGPGRHLWRTPDPTRPVAAYFVLVQPVEVPFDMYTQFVIPATGQPIQLRATGSVQIRCADPSLLVAQFVGLPFDQLLNEGIMRSVSRSAERMVARLLTRRVVMAGTPLVVTDATMQAGILEEIVAYNPTAGAVFGIELMRVGQLAIHADDGVKQYATPPMRPPQSSQPIPQVQSSQPIAPIPMAATSGMNGHHDYASQHPQPLGHGQVRVIEQSVNIDLRSSPPGPPQTVVSGEIGGAREHRDPRDNRERGVASGEIGGGKSAPPKPVTDKQVAPPPPLPASTRAGSQHDVPVNNDITKPAMPAPVIPGRTQTAPPLPPPPAGPPSIAPRAIAAGSTPSTPARGAIMGIGVSQIAAGSASGEIGDKVQPGGRVLVPGPNGLMQSATVRQLVSGYYELEVGSSGETIWVPFGGVVPE